QSSFAPLDFVFIRKRSLCHNIFTSLVLVFSSQKYSNTPYLREQRGFLFFLMVDQGATADGLLPAWGWHVSGISGAYRLTGPVRGAGGLGGRGSERE
ncbi:MAG: hypothetical protein ACM3MB_06890, partial [Acidobacteriota bacterium]